MGPNAWNVISLPKSVSIANWIFLLTLYTFGYAIVFCLLGFCSSECHSLFMHCMESYFLLSGLNLLSFSSTDCPLSCVLGNMEKKSSQQVLFGVFIIFLVISLLADVILGWGIHFFHFFSNDISLNLPISPSNFAILIKMMPLLLHTVFEGNTQCCWFVQWNSNNFLALFHPNSYSC